MTKSSKPAPRELVAFAFVQEEYVKTGDISSGLMKLFVPVLSGDPNRIFEPHQFAKQVEIFFDIPMTTLAAEGLIPKLLEADLIYAESGASKTYRIRPMPERPTLDDRDNISDLLSEFIDFARRSIMHRGLKVDDAVLENSLMRRVVTLDFLSFLERPDRNVFGDTALTHAQDEESGKPEYSLERVLDVVCAQFALQLLETKPEQFDLLVKIASGALIADVVLTLQEPSSVGEFRNLKFVFDSPLILDILDLSTPELHDFASSLLETVDRVGVCKQVFRHVVEEVIGSIRTPLATLNRGDRPYGPLGDRIQYDNDHAAYARTILDNIEGQLLQRGFEIIDAQDFTGKEFERFCPEDLKDAIRVDLGIHEHLERWERDALSLSTVLRARKPTEHPSTITEAGIVFITRNTYVANKSRKTLLARRRLRPSDIPPALTDRQISGLLWLVVGGNIGLLSLKKLVANCSMVMHPGMDIVSKMREMLTNLDPNKAELFEALMRDRRAQRCLVHSTLGLPMAITPQNAGEILDEMRKSTATEVKQEEEEKAQRREAELIETYDRIVNEKDKRIVGLEEKHDKLKDTLEGEVKKSRGAVYELNTKLENLQNLYDSDMAARVSKTVASAKRAALATKGLIIAAYMFVVTLPSFLVPNSYLTNLFIVIGAVLGFWIVPHYLFDPIVKRVWRFTLEKSAERLGVVNELNMYVIDEKTMDVKHSDARQSKS